jgi:hypothetical protein
MHVSRDPVQPFYRCTEKVRRGWVQHNGGRRGRDKAAARAWRRWCVVAGSSILNGHVACAHRAWVDSGKGRAIWPRAGGTLFFGTAHRQASSARWPAAAAPRRDRTREGSEERGREREKG